MTHAEIEQLGGHTMSSSSLAAATGSVVDSLRVTAPRPAVVGGRVTRLPPDANLPTRLNSGQSGQDQIPVLNPPALTARRVICARLQIAGVLQKGLKPARRHEVSLHALPTVPRDFAKSRFSVRAQ
jgi:hypothetical protein